MKKITYFITILISFSSLWAWAGKNIVIGEDHRTDAPLAYPFSSVGRLSTTSGLFCTGFLVSKSVVVTNAHCVINKSKEVHPAQEIEFFLPSLKKSFTAKKVKIAEKYFQNSYRYDFAFIEIDEEAGHDAGYFGTRSFESNLEKKDILQLAGFANDYKYGWELFQQSRPCQAMKPSSEGLIMHTCDMETGSSGAPIFIKSNEKFYVVGINSRQSSKGACNAFEEKNCFNLAVPFQQIGQELVEFQKKN